MPADSLTLELEAIGRSTNLHELTEIVRRGRSVTTETIFALKRIREAKLYKQTHSSWDSWCQDNWWSSKRHADRQIGAVDIAAEIGTQVPLGGRVARELVASTPEDRAAIVDEAKEIRGASGQPGPPTAGELRQAIDRRAGGKKKPPGIQDRRTPAWFFAELDRRFGPFELDAFASAENALYQKYYTEKDNGLERPWPDRTFGNCEFRTMMAAAVAKAVVEGGAGRRSCLLGPAVGSQEWFHEDAIKGTIWMPDCRINFDDAGGNATGSRCEEGGADRDTVVMTFGREHGNAPRNVARGVFRVKKLPVKHLRPGEMRDDVSQL